MEKEIITLWQTLGISQCKMKFNCGGDSMGDTEFIFTDAQYNEINSNELLQYFELSVYDNVEFYENSDGHYQGESGTVIITLYLDLDDELDFLYSKNALAEYNEEHTNVISVSLTKEMLDFLELNVGNLNGNEYESNINYKKDLLLSNEDEELIANIQLLVSEAAENHTPDDNDIQSKLDDGWSYSTELGQYNNNDEVKIKEDKLLLSVSNRIIIYRDSDEYYLS